MRFITGKIDENPRLFIATPAGPVNVVVPPLFESASKYKSAGEARLKVYRSCSPETEIEPFTTLPRVKG